MENTNEIINKILDRVAEEQQYDDCEINVQCISSGLSNHHTSFPHRATISAPGKEDLKLFVKIAAMNEKVRSTSQLRLFEIESLFYNKVLKTYQDIEERHTVPTEHRLVTPKFYGSSEETYKEALVLEDITSQGYQIFDRFKSIDWKYASKSVKNLAKLHALSIAWSVDDPEAFNDNAALKSDAIIAIILRFMKNVVGSSLEVIKPENKERVWHFFQEATNDNVFTDFYKPMRCPVIAHLDYRPENLLHRVHDDGEIDIVSVDYQTCRISNPIIDLLFFIFTGSDKNYRKHHFKETIEEYYKELCAALMRLDLKPDEIYSREDSEYERQRVMPFGLLASMTMLLVTMARDENAYNVDNIIEINDSIIIPSELYKQRLNDIIDEYIDMGLL